VFGNCDVRETEIKKRRRQKVEEQYEEEIRQEK
jgi:hypothetical protein